MSFDFTAIVLQMKLIQ